MGMTPLKGGALVFPPSFPTSLVPSPTPTSSLWGGRPTAPSPLALGNLTDIPHTVVVLSCLAPVRSHSQSWLAFRLAGSKTHIVSHCECSRNQREGSTLSRLSSPDAALSHPYSFTAL